MCFSSSSSAVTKSSSGRSNISGRNNSILQSVVSANEESEPAVEQGVQQLWQSRNYRVGSYKRSSTPSRGRIGVVKVPANLRSSAIRVSRALRVSVLQ